MDVPDDEMARYRAGRLATVLDWLLLGRLSTEHIGLRVQAGSAAPKDTIRYQPRTCSP